ncbi:hypothetical protein LJ361_13855 [Brucella sp. JSBI001]|nr:hypothetical protein [Brucella sp. JSBI001]UZD68245.1 hypothetical protein LJ361_13855 [Brucella sp. JSBI001]
MVTIRMFRLLSARLPLFWASLAALALTRYTRFQDHPVSAWFTHWAIMLDVITRSFIAAVVRGDELTVASDGDACAHHLLHVFPVAVVVQSRLGEL